MMSELIKIFKISHLAVAQCQTLDISYQDSTLEIILACYSVNKIVAYINQCPHTGVNLNWQQNQCFDFTQRYLACSLHGALFEPKNGLCIHGPCIGQYLTPIGLIIKDGDIFIDPKAIF